MSGREGELMATAQDLRDLVMPPQIQAYCVVDQVTKTPDGDIAIGLMVMHSQTYRSVRLKVPFAQADELWKQLGAVLGS